MMRGEGELKGGGNLMGLQMGAEIRKLAWLQCGWDDWAHSQELHANDANGGGCRARLGCSEKKIHLASMGFLMSHRQ